MFHSIDISTSGLVAQRQRLNAIAGNIANLSTTRSAEGEPSAYQRRFVTFHAASEDPADGPSGVRYQLEVDATTPPRRVHQPDHPDADADGYVAYPNIDLTSEFVNSLEATRAYQANLAAMETSKEMIRLGLQILS